jgi:hypothetical protein
MNATQFVFRMILAVNSYTSLTSYFFYRRSNVFPVRYELNSYIVCGKNSVLDMSQSESSQSHQRVKYGHESPGTRSKESLCRL